MPFLLFMNVLFVNLFAKKNKKITSYCYFILELILLFVYLHRVFIVLDF